MAVQAGEPFDLTVKVTNDAGSVIQEINSSFIPNKVVLCSSQKSMRKEQPKEAKGYTPGFPARNE